MLGVATEEEAAAAIATWGAVDLETAVHAAGGVGAAARTTAQWRAEVGNRRPLTEHVDLAPAPPRPPVARGCST